ncbi:MAG TPA: polysaccharide deacetylase family protein [Armatimonadota bacterium]|jgi:hypothetical protein
MAEITVILGIDVETDVGSWYHSYAGVVEGIPLLLDSFAAHGATGTFFVTGHAAQQNPESIRLIPAAGHEVGCHSLYHETVGEPIFPIPGVTPLLPEEVEHRLAVATDWVQEAVGFRPVSFRCPRLFGGTHVVRALEALGYATDASYPLYHYQERLVPYHPDANDWTQEGDLKLLEIPNFADMTIASTDPFGRDRDQWPLFRTQNAAALLGHVDNFIGYVRERNLPPVLCFYFHPWEFLPMAESLFVGEGTVVPDRFLIENCGPYALEQFGLLLDGLNERGTRYTTCQQLAKEWA